MWIWVLSCAGDTSCLEKAGNLPKGELGCLDLVRDIKVRGAHIPQEPAALAVGCLGTGAVIPAIFPTRIPLFHLPA